MSRRRSSLLPALALAVACGAEDPASLAGDYVREHDVFVFHGNEPVQVRAEDRLHLEAASTGLGFELSIVGSAGQVCRAQGVAAARRGSFELRPEVGQDHEGPRCLLRISADEREIAVEDVDGGCRELYCEGGAAIERTLFPRPPQR